MDNPLLTLLTIGPLLFLLAIMGLGVLLALETWQDKRRTREIVALLQLADRCAEEEPTTAAMPAIDSAAVEIPVISEPITFPHMDEENRMKLIEWLWLQQNQEPAS